MINFMHRGGIHHQRAGAVLKMPARRGSCLVFTRVVGGAREDLRPALFAFLDTVLEGPFLEAGPLVGLVGDLADLVFPLLTCALWFQAAATPK